jgi:hypothetical protein
VELAREAGFQWACTTVAQRVKQGTGPLVLGRFAAPNRPDIGFLR